MVKQVPSINECESHSESPKQLSFDFFGGERSFLPTSPHIKKRGEISREISSPSHPRLRSPLPWVGGKFYLAQKILTYFPPPETYHVYVEPFGGAGHVLINKPKYHHYEVFNDINGDLINFWIMVRDFPDLLQQRLDTLPYSRELYYLYHQSLWDNSSMDKLERAARWFYVLRSSFSPVVRRSPSGWIRGRNGPQSLTQHTCHAQSFRSATALFPLIAQRFRTVEIDNRDYSVILDIAFHERECLFYCDPPYIGKEQYYISSSFDHKALAERLNALPARILLSYYYHPILEQLYPPHRWKYIMLTGRKHIQRSLSTHEVTCEVLLLNY